MVAVAVATLIVGDRTIYANQLKTQSESPAHRHRFSFPLLTAMPVEGIVRPVSVLPASLSVREAIDAMRSVEEGYALVSSASGALVGEVQRGTLEAVADASSILTGFAEPSPATIPVSASFDRALDILADADCSWLPVVDPEYRPIGVLGTKEIMRAYHSAVERDIRVLAPLSPDVETIEVLVGEQSTVVGVRLADAGLPAGVRALTVLRQAHTFAPVGDTVLAAGDRVVLAVPSSLRATALRALFDS